ncbi:MAG TPA: hypothetical protein VGB65_01890 [Allosphingosinicella sp.]
MQKITILAAAYMLAGCASSNPVETSGKIGVPLAEVPAEALAAATAARPGFRFVEAERETRDGRRYFDVGGTLADGGEIEFDIMEEGGRWRVAEIQRDIALSAAPAPVREAAARHDAAFAPTRIIESDQTDGIVIYELFGAKGGDPRGRKVEIKWDGSRAEVLTKEWAH